MKIEKREGWTLGDGRKVYYYTVGEGSESWDMEVILDADGNPDPECDANLEYARKSVEVWTAWADFVEQKNKEGWA